MNDHCLMRSIDQGPEPYVVNMNRAAVRNACFRTALWTGENLQVTLMSIPVQGEIGWEIHNDTDQYLRIEYGNAAVFIGKCSGQQDYREDLMEQDGIYIPAGTWHNIVNTGCEPLKLSSVYAPPHHPRGIVQAE